MKVNGRLRTLPAIPLVKHSGTHSIGGCTVPRDGLDTLEKEKSLAPVVICPPYHLAIASHYTDCHPVMLHTPTVNRIKYSSVII